MQVEAGFIQQAPGFASILATAGGQMFFSLSLAMGAMITYGSYLGKGENLAKNAGIIVTGGCHRGHPGRSCCDSSCHRRTALLRYALEPRC